MDFITEGKNNNKGYRLMLSHLDQKDLPHALYDHTCFKLILIETGTGCIKHEHIEEHYSAPSLLCVNQDDIFAAEAQSLIHTQTLCFHPCIINNRFDFDNIRSKKDFTATEMQDCYLLAPFIERNAGYKAVTGLDPDYYRRVSNLFYCVREELRDQSDTAWPCRSRSFLLELLILINRLCQENAGESTKKTDNQIADVIAYLQTHYNEKITVELLTRRFKMNRTSLNSRFVEETQLSVIDYLIKLRIRFASAFMRDTRLNISEIIERTGFTNHTHFWRMFKKHTGLSPSEYRTKYCWMK